MSISKNVSAQVGATAAHLAGVPGASDGGLRQFDTMSRFGESQGLGISRRLTTQHRRQWDHCSEGVNYLESMRSDAQNPVSNSRAAASQIAIARRRLCSNFL
jgi:hypothetical protein